MDIYLYIIISVIFLVLISIVIANILKIPFILVFLINLLTGGLGILFFLILCVFSLTKEDINIKKK
jgi:hypothetical protein